MSTISLDNSDEEWNIITDMSEELGDQIENFGNRMDDEEE